jgi:hypothetical protein
MVRPFGAHAGLLAHSSPGLSNRARRVRTETTATRVLRTNAIRVPSGAQVGSVFSRPSRKSTRGEDPLARATRISLPRKERV